MPNNKFLRALCAVALAAFYFSSANLSAQEVTPTPPEASGEAEIPPPDPPVPIDEEEEDPPAPPEPTQEIPPVPEPTPGVPEPEIVVEAQITIDDNTGLSLDISGPSSRVVQLPASHTATAVLQYDASYSGVIPEVEALDGGAVTFPGNQNFVAADGSFVLQFSGAQEPGLYRFAVNCAGTESMVQFWVPDPDAPEVDPSIAVPQPIVN